MTIEQRIAAGETALVNLIPKDRYILRRIVACRSLINPETGKHQYSWRALANNIGADVLAVKRWHATGIKLIQEQLEQQKDAA